MLFAVNQTIEHFQ